MNTESDNVMVWDGNRTGHYEVWFATFNHRKTKTGYWIRYTLTIPAPDQGEPYCQLWFAAFNAEHPEKNLAINRRFPIDQLEGSEAPFQLNLGGATLRHDSMEGDLEGDTHRVSWKLSYKPTLFTHRHLPEMIYSSQFAPTRFLSPNLIINLFGEVTVDGETFTFEGDPGNQCHLWGRKHAHAHVWSHCNSFREDPTACIEAGSYKIKRLGVVTPAMHLMSLYLGSEVYHLNQLSNIPFNRGSWETGLYRFSGVGRRIKIEGEMRCRPEDLVRATYHDPDGETYFCHNTEVASASLTLWTRRSWRSPFKKLGRLTSRETAHFEVATRSPDGHVTRQHITVP